MTAPAYVATPRGVDSFQPGGSLPVLSPTPRQITDQPTLDAVLLAAGKAGVALSISATAAGNIGPAAPPAPSDGQVLAWSGTLGQYVPAAPAGQSRVAAASNTTSTPTAASATAGTLGAAVDIPGAVISVPPSAGRPVVVKFGANLQQTVAGTGDVFLSLNETTAGSTGTRYSALVPLPGSASTQPTYESAPYGEFDLGVVASTRTFKLSLAVWGGTGSPTVQALNAPDNPTFIRAVAE